MQTAAHGRAGVANWQLMHEGRWAKLVLESYYGERSDQLKWANNSPEIEASTSAPVGRASVMSRAPSNYIHGKHNYSGSKAKHMQHRGQGSSLKFTVSN